MKKILYSLVGLVVVCAAILGGYKFYKGSNLGARLNPAERTVMSEVVTSTVGNTMNVADFAFISWTVATDAASGTLKFACSMSDTAPVFSASQSVTNRWDYVDVIDYEDDASIDGDTGLTLANTSDVRQFVMDNVNFRWCTTNLSSWTAGTTTVKLLGTTNF